MAPEDEKKKLQKRMAELDAEIEAQKRAREDDEIRRGTATGLQLARTRVLQQQQQQQDTPNTGDVNMTDRPTGQSTNQPQAEFKTRRQGSWQTYNPGRYGPDGPKSHNPSGQQSGQKQGQKSGRKGPAQGQGPSERRQRKANFRRGNKPSGPLPVVESADLRGSDDPARSRELRVVNDSKGGGPQHRFMAVKDKKLYARGTAEDHFQATKSVFGNQTFDSISWQPTFGGGASYSRDQSKKLMSLGLQAMGKQRRALPPPPTGRAVTVDDTVDDSDEEIQVIRKEAFVPREAAGEPSAEDDAMEGTPRPEDDAAREGTPRPEGFDEPPECPNCAQQDFPGLKHWLEDCNRPCSTGKVPGCPPCNIVSPSHNIRNCCKFLEKPLHYRYDYLVVRRGGRPAFDTSWVDVLIEYAQVPTGISEPLPWTSQFGSEYWFEHAAHEDAEEAPTMSVDPSTATLKDAFRSFPEKPWPAWIRAKLDQDDSASVAGHFNKMAV